MLLRRDAIPDPDPPNHVPLPDLIHDLHTPHHVPEHGVAGVEMRLRRVRNEEHRRVKTEAQRQLARLTAAPR